MTLDTYINTVHHMDALALMRSLPDASVDMILTSPPYDNLRKYKGYSWDFEGIAKESYRVLKDGGVLVWVVGDATVNGSETLTSMRQALYFVDTVGFRMHQRIIWEKQGLPTKRPKAYLPDFEDIFVLSKGEPSTFNPLMRKNARAGEIKQKGSSGVNGWSVANGHRVIAEQGLLTNVWRIGVGWAKSSLDKVAFEHPAIFPEQLAERHILTWTNPGDIVLDYFMGSGTTAKMARNTGRRFIGCDISQDYVDLANRRLAQPHTPDMFYTLAAAE